MKRLTKRQKFAMIYPMRVLINRRARLWRTLPIPRGASWGWWFLRKVKTQKAAR